MRVFQREERKKTKGMAIAKIMAVPVTIKDLVPKKQKALDQIQFFLFFS